MHCTVHRTARHLCTASRLAPQELTPSNLRLLRPALLAAGYRAPFEQPHDQRSFNGAEPYFAALMTRAPLGPLVAPRFVPYASRRGTCTARAWHVHCICMAFAWGRCMASAWHVHCMCMACAC